ncbi:MAG: sugar phosphate isomerase/epimerase family protein [Chthoniobacteraceae bacterium]
MKLNQVGFQLYTCRDLLKTPEGIVDTLKRLREIGYTTLELCGVDAVPAEELARIIAGEGFKVVSSHEPSADLLACPEKSIERLDLFGCSAAAYPYPGGIDFGSRAAVEELIAKLQHAGEVLGKAGKSLAYHNHHVEFRKLDGKIILDRIYDSTSKTALKAELDTFWVQRGGGSVVEWVQKLSGRMEVIHLKDYMINDQTEAQFCEIGAGNINFKPVVAAAEAGGCQWFVVEQDTCPGDPVDSLAQSFRYIQGNLI